VDEVQKLRAEIAKLEKEEKVDRVRQIASRRRRESNRRFKSRVQREDAGGASEARERMDELLGNLEKIEELKTQRLPLVERRRALLEEIGVRFRVGGKLLEKINEKEEQARTIDESLGKIQEARKLLKRASGKMQGAKKHITGAKKASYMDMLGVGGIVGEMVSTHYKHKKMDTARASMAPAKAMIRKANNLLRSVNVRGATTGRGGVPQLDVFCDIFLDGLIVDGQMHDEIAKAERDAAMTAKRVANRARTLRSVEKAFQQQLDHARSLVDELHLRAESAAAARLVEGA
jgi:hypothetical protein